MNECTLTVETVKAARGDEVCVGLNIANNPGIMAVTISITYNPAALKLMDYYYGDVFTDYTVAAHPDRKLIRLVISQGSEKTADGRVAGFKFKVTEDAEAGLHKMSVEYSKGDFCNSNLESLYPPDSAGRSRGRRNGVIPMISRVAIGKTFYEIIGGKEPEVIEFTVDSYIVNPDGSVTFPDKYIGLATYSDYVLGLTVFEDEESANIKLEQIRSVSNG